MKKAAAEDVNHGCLFFCFTITPISTSGPHISERSENGNVFPCQWTQISKEDVWMKKTDIVSGL